MRTFYLMTSYAVHSVAYKQGFGVESHSCFQCQKAEHHVSNLSRIVFLAKVAAEFLSQKQLMVWESNHNILTNRCPRQHVFFLRPLPLLPPLHSSMLPSPCLSSQWELWELLGLWTEKGRKFHRGIKKRKFGKYYKMDTSSYWNNTQNSLEFTNWKC